MTDERKNEIWAMLTPNEKLYFNYHFKKHTGEYDWGYQTALIDIFGSHNLTYQTKRKCTNPTENGISDPKIQSESAESVETSENPSNSFQSFTDWNKYRLDLAKELAVAKMNRQGVIDPREVVEDANEIVKRLKETEA